MRFNRLSSGIAIIALMTVVAISGCTTGTNTTQSAMDAANAAADRILTSFNSGSYADFSTNFSSAMLSAVNESWFNSTRTDTLNLYGKFVSRSSAAPQVSTQQGYNSYTYDCQFEKNTLLLQVVMNGTNVYTVEGMFFPPSAGNPSQQAIDAANATADRILGALNNGSYSGFTENFSSAILPDMSESKFNDTRNGIIGQYGKYVSRSSMPVTMISLKDNVFVYESQFEKAKLNFTLEMGPSSIWTVDGVLFTA